MTKTEILDQFPFLNADSVSANSMELRRQAEQFSTLGRLGPGTHFYRQGERCPHLALVGSGSIRVYQPSLSGREITLYYVNGGQTCMINMMCAFADNSSPATAVVEQEVTALLLPAGLFRQWYHQFEAVRDYAIDALSGRLREVMALVQEVAFQRLDQRLAEHLIQRFAGLAGERPQLVATHESLAADLGSSREVITRLLKEFQRRGAVMLKRGRIELLSREVLRDISSARL